MAAETLTELIRQYDRFSIGCKNSFSKISIDDYSRMTDKGVPDFEYRCIVLSLDIARIHYEEILCRLSNQTEPIPNFKLPPFLIWCYSDYGENIMKTIRERIKSKLKKDILPNDIID